MLASTLPCTRAQIIHALVVNNINKPGSYPAVLAIRSSVKHFEADNSYSVIYIASRSILATEPEQIAEKCPDVSRYHRLAYGNYAHIHCVTIAL